MAGFYFLSKNHYFCDSGKADQTRVKEKKAESFTKYPNTTKYEIESSCGGIDGTPNATIQFYTADGEEKVFDFYEDLFANKGQKIVSRENNMLCTNNLCVTYDPRQNGIEGYKWWNVDIRF